MKTVPRQIGVILFLFNAVIIAMANDYFAAPHGNNDSPGTFDKPFRTIQRGIDVLERGDNLYVFPGIYREKILMREIEGNENQPVTICALGQVKLTGGLSLKGKSFKDCHSKESLSDPVHHHPLYGGTVVRIENCSYLTFSGFCVYDSEAFGIGSLKCDNLTIERCIMCDTGTSGIYVYDGKEITVKFNEVMRACSYPRRIGENGTEEAISIVSCDGFEVMYNRVHESGNVNHVEGLAPGVGGEGIDVKEHSKNGSVHHNYVWNLVRLGFYIDAWNAQDMRNISFYNNVTHNTNGIALGCEDGGQLHDIRVYNNLSYNSLSAGLLLADWVKGGKKEDIYIVNNSFFYNWAGALNLGSEKHRGIEIVNNLMWKNNLAGEEEVLRGSAHVIRFDGNLVGEDPLLREPGIDAYFSAKEGPGVDKGVSSSPFTIDRDLNDGVRIVGDRIDVGAFESGSRPISPRVVYVSPRGSDAASGTFYTPYHSIQKALDSLNPGDKLVILEGVYFENLRLENFKGDSGDPLQIIGLGCVTVLPVTNDPLLALSRVESLSIEGIDFRQQRNQPVIVADQCKFMEIENNRLRNVDHDPVVLTDCENISLKLNGFSTQEDNVSTVGCKKVRVEENDPTLL
jgi:hypothetical protein